MRASSISDFQVQCKRYFSSLTLRQCKYVYLNIPGHKDVCVVSNGDIALLTSYTPSLLSMHVIRPKNEFLTLLKMYLKIDQQPDKDAIVVVKVAAICAACKDARIEESGVNVSSTGDISIVSGKTIIAVDDTSSDDDDIDSSDDEEDTAPAVSFGASVDEKADAFLENPFTDDGWDTCIKKQLFTEKTVCGVPLPDVYAAKRLTEIVDTILCEADELETLLAYQALGLSEECEGKSFTVKKYLTKSIREDTFPVGMYIHSNWFRSEQYITGELFDKQYTSPMPRPEQFFLFMMDGYDCPSFKEFLRQIWKSEKKQKSGIEDSRATLSQYVYTINNQSVKCQMHYADPTVSITSTRPFYEEVLLCDVHKEATT